MSKEGMGASRVVRRQRQYRLPRRNFLPAIDRQHSVSVKSLLPRVGASPNPQESQMNKTLIALGIAVAAVMPAAAFAHTNLSIGVGLGGPVYAPPPAVVYAPPPPVYVAPPPVYEYETPAYVYGPPVVYGPNVEYRGYYGPRYYRPYRY